jgi:hypothetical protein
MQTKDNMTTNEKENIERKLSDAGVILVQVERFLNRKGHKFLSELANQAELSITKLEEELSRLEEVE